MTQSLAQFVGVDISKESLDVHVSPDGSSHRFENSPAGHKALRLWLNTWSVDRIVYEPTGPYHRAFEHALRDQPLVKVNPRRARRFAQAIGALAKTDRADAAMLAQLAATLKPPVQSLKASVLAELHELLVAKRGLVRDRTAMLNRGKILTIPLLKTQNAQRLAQVERQIAAIAAACKAIIDADPKLSRRRDIVASVAGLGKETAVTLIADMPELGCLEPGQAASLAGLAPITRQSGQWRGKSFIQGGRAIVRCALYMPALVAIRFNPDMKAKYDQLIAAGKPAKVAITAIMRKLIVLVNALLKADRTWQPKMA